MTSTKMSCKRLNTDWLLAGAHLIPSRFYDYVPLVGVSGQSIRNAMDSSGFQMTEFG